MEDIDELLNSYEPGKLEYKQDVIKQIKEIREKREKLINEHTQRQNAINKNNILIEPHNFQNIINEQMCMIQQLTTENGKLNEKVKYLEKKITQFIQEKIQEKNQEKNNLI